MKSFLKFLKEWAYQSYLSWDNALNATLFAGSADESISSRCFRLNHIRAYRVLEIAIDAGHYPFQGADHCKKAYLRDALGRQKPREFYKKAIEMGVWPLDPDKLGDLVELPK